MSSAVNWQKHPAVVVWSDDWGMNAWAPTEESYHATRHEELMQTRWSSGSLESPADLERTFNYWKHIAAVTASRLCSNPTTSWAARTTMLSAE